MKTLRASFLALFVMSQLLFPIRAYAVAPIVVAAYASVGVHVGALLALSLNKLAVSKGGSSVAARLDGKTDTPVPGWPQKTGSDGKPYSVPPPTAKPEKITGSRINYWIRGVSGPFVSVPEHAPADLYHQQMNRLCTSQPGFKYVTGEGHCRDSINRTVPVDNSGVVNFTAEECPVGYMMSSSNTCELSHPDLAKKPPGVACEPVFFWWGF